MAEKRKYARKYCKYCEAKIEFMDYKDDEAYLNTLCLRDIKLCLVV